MFLDVSDVDTSYDLLVQSICQVSHSFYFQPCGDVKGIGLILHRGNCALKKKKHRHQLLSDNPSLTPELPPPFLASNSKNPINVY